MPATDVLTFAVAFPFTLPFPIRGTRDTEHCVSLLKDSLLPLCNQFCYGQVKSAYGSGRFKKDLDTAFKSDEKVVTSDIQHREGILPSIKAFLGKGR